MSSGVTPVKLDLPTFPKLLSSSPEKKPEVKPESFEETLTQDSVQLNPHLRALTSTREQVLEAVDNERAFALANLDAEAAESLQGLSEALNSCDGETYREMLESAKKNNFSDKISSISFNLDRKVTVEPLNKKDQTGINRLKWAKRLGIAVTAAAAAGAMAATAYFFGGDAAGFFIGLYPALGAGWAVGSLSNAVYTEFGTRFTKNIVDRSYKIADSEEAITKALNSPSDPTEAKGHNHSKASLVEKATKQMAGSQSIDEVKAAEKKLQALKALPGEDAAAMFAHAFDKEDKSGMSYILGSV